MSTSVRLGSLSFNEPSSLRTATTTHRQGNTSRRRASQSVNKAPIRRPPTPIVPAPKPFAVPDPVVAKGDDHGDENETLPFCMSSDCFMDHPMVTFLLDRPRDLTCMICTESKLEFGSSSRHARQPAEEGGGLGALADTVPVIFPCGHVIGYQCAHIWLEDHDCCPVCRFDLRYKGCHALHRRSNNSQTAGAGRKEENKKKKEGTAMPKILDRSSVHMLPLTVSEGGKLTEKCFECEMEDLSQKATLGFKRLTRQLVMAREQYRLTKDEGFLAEAEALADMQRVHIKETFYVPRETWMFNHW